MKSRTTSAHEWLLAGLHALPFVFLLLVWPQLPATVPTHYGFDGQPDRFGAKSELAGVMGFTTLFLYGLLRVVPSIDPKQRLSPQRYNRTRWTFSTLWSAFLLVMFVTVWRGNSAELMPNVVLAFVFLLFAGLGNAMNSLPANYFVGIRTPWALENDDNWRRTHRLAGRVWLVGGLLGLLVGLLLPEAWKIGWILLVTVAVSLIPMIYSFVLFRRGKPQA